MCRELERRSVAGVEAGAGGLSGGDIAVDGLDW